MAGRAGGGGRATPADPMPGVTVDESVPSTEGRKLPPELGPDAVAILESRTFMYSDGIGDVRAGTIGGLVHNDTRLLSTWLLTVNGARPLAVQAQLIEHYWAAFYLSNPALPGLNPYSVGIHRQRLLGDAMRERVALRSFVNEPLDLELRLSVGNDFADIFEIKDKVRDRSAEIVREHSADNCRLRFGYRSGEFEAHTVVNARPAADLIDGDDLVWRLRLAPGEQWLCDLDVPLRFGTGETRPPARSFGSNLEAPADDPVSVWRRKIVHLHSDSALITRIVETTGRDMVALRMAGIVFDEEVRLPAAGLPWFLSLFGRDTIITAYQALSFGPFLARASLLTLAKKQGRRRDDFRDEEPGKIMHEYRCGELTALGKKPHDPYYGSADSTPLWLILLSEYWRWTGDDDLVRQLRAPAMAALNWIDEYGDRDGDGYVEYQTRSPAGLGNQCWRDSWDGVQYADGNIPVLPIATCEIQGYVYDAKLRLAELADGPLADPDLAGRLREQAARLRDRFDRDFWIDGRGGYYAVGLDGDKRRIDSLTSNIGHLLWSGIVPPERAQPVVDRLMSQEMFSGWGVRTLSTVDAGYNPIGYHHGTVWPHDNSIIAAGLARYGYRDEANRIAKAMFEAAEHTGYRLPETLSGHPREATRFPVRYPTACSPQAWASASPMLFLKSMIGLAARHGRVEIDPRVPDEWGEIVLEGVYTCGVRWNVTAAGTSGHVDRF
jgi:glycogen debranching enzyme